MPPGAGARAWILLSTLLMMGMLMRVSLGSQRGEEVNKDYYALLEINQDASETEIKKAYRKLAQTWHPDKNPTNKEAAAAHFAKIAEAYEVLGNQERRSEYDAYVKEARLAADIRQGVPPFSRQAHWRNPFDMFEEMFGGIYAEEDPLYYDNPDGGMHHDSVVYEEEEHYVFNGREYVRTQRLYGDGRTEVVTRELGRRGRQSSPVNADSSDSDQGRRSARSRTRESQYAEHDRPGEWQQGGGERDEGRRHQRDTRKPPNHFQQQHGKRHFELRSDERLHIGDVLQARDGTSIAYLDSARGTLVVEARSGPAGHYRGGGTKEEDGRVEWEAPVSWGADAGKQAIYATLTSRGLLELRSVGKRGNERVMWASAEGGSVAEHWSLPHRYVLVLEERGGHGNLCVYSQTGLDRECIWASLGCDDEGLDTLVLRGMTKRVLGPLLRGCGRVFCVVRDQLLVKAKVVKPQLSKGVKRLQELMRKTARNAESARNAVTELFGRFQAVPPVTQP